MSSEKAKTRTMIIDRKQLRSISQSTLRRIGKSSLSTWKLYRQSLTGLAGLGIVMAFFIMAVFAPWIAPYSPTFKAPAIDTFIADYVTVPLGEKLNWTRIIGLTEASGDAPLKRVMMYSEEGVARVIPVTYGISAETGEIGIVVGDAISASLPKNATYLDYAHFRTSIFFVLNTTQEPGSEKPVSTLYEYTYSLAYSDEHVLPFPAKYYSNLWNGYTPTLREMRLALAFANETMVWLMDRRPPMIWESASQTYFDELNLTNATIIGNPLVVDGSFDMGNMLFVPTDKGLEAYTLNVTKSNLTGAVSRVSIGNLIWTSEYSVDGEPFEPITGQGMITFQYPYGPTSEDGKTHVVMATKDGRIVAFERKTGNVSWTSRIISPTIRDYTLTSVYPSPTSFIVIGKTGDRGLIAGLDPDTGAIGYGVMLSTFEGYANSPPQYVWGLKRYVLSTEDGTIRLMNQLLQINATFAVPGGAISPVSFLGNIYISDSIAGNYFGIVTANNSLFMETLSGVNIAPLPPGTYPSGNNYPLGTDYEGHDILTLVIYGTRAELLVGITAALFSVVIGTIVGLVAGFYSGFIDDILMRATDVVLSLPYLVIMLLFAAVFGPSLWNIIIIIAILSWAGIARVIRSVTLSIKERAFVDAAIIAGASETRLIFRHIGPNVLPYTFLYMTFGVSGAIVTEAILAFLGFGDPNHITWGMMLQFLQISGHSLDAPWWLLPPGIAITLISLAFYLIGRAFDEVVNPRLRKR